MRHAKARSSKMGGFMSVTSGPKTRQEVLAIVKEMLHEHTNVPIENILESSQLGKDLRLGEVLGLAEFRVLKNDIEKKFGIELDPDMDPDQETQPERISKATVGQLVKFISKHLLVP